MKKAFMVQIISGIITFILGIVTMLYGFGFITGRIQGSVRTCMLLLLLCVVAVICCIMQTVRNTRKYRTKSENMWNK